MNFFDIAIAVINLGTAIVLTMGVLALAITVVAGIHFWRSTK